MFFNGWDRSCRNRMALIEARLVTAKLLWNFDIELDGDHMEWVEDARFYVSRLVADLAPMLTWVN